MHYENCDIKPQIGHCITFGENDIHVVYSISTRVDMYDHVIYRIKTICVFSALKSRIRFRKGDKCEYNSESVCYCGIWKYHSKEQLEPVLNIHDFYSWRFNDVI